MQNSCKILKSLTLLIIVMVGVNAVSIAQKKTCFLQNRFPPQEMYSGFKVTPDSIQTSVYWYWISDNISKEGVIKDLESMKKVGINRAFIGNIGLDETPYGKVKIFSDEWWGIIHTALKTATKLGIDIGIFNSPGWSQSGGPWVKPEQAMRYLSSSTITVKGPFKYNKKLLQPIEQFQDVKVIAFPAPKSFSSDIAMDKPAITSDPSNNDIHHIMDGDENTIVSLPVNKPFVVTVKNSYGLYCPQFNDLSCT